MKRLQVNIVRALTGGKLPKAPLSNCKMYAEIRDDCDSVVRVERWPGSENKAQSGPHIWIQCYGYTGGEVPFLNPKQARAIAKALLKFADKPKK